MTITERLGSFYLGKEYDLAAAKLGDAPIMYDARDLTTHAVCVGMTGSGKTGLCIDLMEEAAIDQVPMIIIDPKGDITNLLLTFPELRPEDFQPWINPDDARRKEMTVEAYAASQAESWAKGLASWDQGPERIKLLKESADFVIYTPGSDSGVPVSILSSFAAPQLNWDDEQEALRERISGTVSALLGLIGVEADPVRSREHILLATLFEHYWRAGQSLDLAALINAIQNPPVRQLGVFDVDTFYPQKDRFSLAMALNNIIAAPSFATWIQGVPLDIDHMLYGGDARPNVSIFYIAHLSDAERMFFVTLLLEQVITWMRAQGGTTSLRALLYMDEVFGYFPPTGNPPSKRPMLTLLKQARAFGLGVMLTTQNPVDLDYKGLTNAGTWFIGKLQADRDKQRLLDGLEGLPTEGSNRPNRQELDKIISALGNRVFLLHNVNQSKPVIFQTRWAMSYLRGPLTRSQVRELVKDQRAELLGQAAPATPTAVAPASPSAAQPAAPAGAAPPAARAAIAPGLPPDVPQVYLPTRRSKYQALGDLESRLGFKLNVTGSSLRYDAQILGMAAINFVDDKRSVRQQQEIAMLVAAPSGSGLVRWDQASPLDLGHDDLASQPEEDAVFGETPATINTARKLAALSSDLADYLFRNQSYPLFYSPPLKVYSMPGEDERAFKIRLQQVAREQRDGEVDKLAARVETKLNSLQEKLRREEIGLQKDQAAYDARKQQEMLSAGDSLLSLFGGRRRVTSALGSASQKRQMTARAKQEVLASQETIARLNQEIADLQAELESISQNAADRWSQAQDQIEPYAVRPRKSDVSVQRLAVAWTPQWLVTFQDTAGQERTETVSAI
ncbi:MAG: type IV secretion system DNA-binding domain-containing protein [Anaerolinea sp.]|nr:type IV secretion system DNA-binding domain-containing protein [Anaerolinea sp.]